MRSLRNELAEAHQTNAELTARIGRANPSEGSRALGLWALERHRQARLASTPLLGLAVGPGADLTVGLTEAIRVELELLREEVGTHAELAALDLGDARRRPRGADHPAHRAGADVDARQAGRRAPGARGPGGPRRHRARRRDRMDRRAAERVGVRIRARGARRHPRPAARPGRRRHAAGDRAARHRRRRLTGAHRRARAEEDHHGTKSDRERIEQLIAPFRVDRPEHFRLADCDPGCDRRREATRPRRSTRLAEGVERLFELQARLAAQETYGVVVALQALDAAGKDGAIKHVMTGLNPQGVTVHSFKTPSTEELAHHFLWRTTKALPRRGQIGIFNRSHYEEVLVVRVHPEFLAGQHLPPAATKGDIWKRRFREINDWERTLVDNGFPIVKVFLHLSKEEQQRRLLARIDTPEKNWKFSMADVHEREHWDDYQAAYEDMLRHTSTEAAPWYVVPADHKWFTAADRGRGRWPRRCSTSTRSTRRSPTPSGPSSPRRATALEAS